MKLVRLVLAHFLVIALLILTQSLALAGESDEELAKKTQNPVASLISVPFQSNWDFDIGPKVDKSNYLLNIQPVIPISLDEKYNLILRTIVPIKANEFPVSTAGLGDVLQSFFFSPKAEIDGWIIGAGPVLLYPTATERSLGTGKLAAGPTAVFLQQKSGWTYGFLGNHLWSYAGNSSRSEVNSTFLQPFVSFTTKTYTALGLNTESTYDWTNEQWTVPINATISQLLKIGGQPLQLQLGYRYYVDAPKYGPDWGIRFQVSFLFPK